MQIRYRNIDCSKMTEEEICETSRLFTENYGMWSPHLPEDRANKPIRYTPEMVRRNFVKKPDCKVVLAYDADRLVGHIFYLRRKGEKFGYITWMLQLVVKKDYREHSIGSKMMQSIWGLSNSYACGLYTSNPMTIKTLENATMRHVQEKLVKKHINKLKSIAGDLFPSMQWIDSYENGIVNTDFPISHTYLKKSIQSAYPGGDFPLEPELPEGKEWLAFTFRSQDPMVDNIESFHQYLEFSEDILKQAYSRMKPTHPWASHTTSEVDFFQKHLPSKGIILDLGCGSGRHSLEFAKRDWTVYGVDFSESNISLAEEKQNEQKLKNVKFFCGDARNFRCEEKVNAVLCLYDVVGSYPCESDNLQILKNAYKNLHTGGILIVSVMNMVLTSKRCKNTTVENIENNLDHLLKLPGSDTMQNTGDIFDGKHLLIDNSTGVVYRKEQFFDENSLPVEYIIRDRRYTLSGIQNLARKAGFSPIESYFVQAGHFDAPLSSTSCKAKEIILIAKKDSVLQSFFYSFLPIGKTWL